MVKDAQRGTALAFATLAAGAVVLLGGALSVDEPSPIDRRVRRRMSAPARRRIAKLAAPLFPLGLPGGYITIAYVLARSLRRRGRSGGPAVVTASWAGWLVHRGLKLVFVRERPRRPGQRRRLDSYPSGHTTGTTALAVAAARVLARHGLVSTSRAMLIAVGAPAIMGVYRLVDDEHWATDVLGGWMLGTSIALTCDALLFEHGGRPGATRGPAVKRAAARRRVHPERPTS